MRSISDRNLDLATRRHFDSMRAWFGLKKCDLANEIGLYSWNVGRSLSSRAASGLSAWAAHRSIQFHEDGFTDRRKKVRVRWKGLAGVP
jgi:hypothetical protein